MISIDNAVELTIKTYLGLPKRVTGLNISRRELDEVSESFPRLLDALEQHAGDKLEGIELGVIDWYHRVRNELYHEGNGLTVERDKVIVYAELAQLLFQRLFGYSIVSDKPNSPDLVGEFVTAWSDLYRALESLARHRFPGQNLRGASSIVPTLAAQGFLDANTVAEIDRLRAARNDVVHGNIRDLRRELIDRTNALTARLKQQVSGTE